MPQFDIGNFPSMILWLLISFGIVVFFFRSYILPNYNISIQSRSQKIEFDIDQKNKITERTSEILHQYHTNLTQKQKQIDDEFNKKALDLDTTSQIEINKIRNKLDQSKKEIDINFQKKHQQLLKQMKPEIQNMFNVAMGILSNTPHKENQHD